MLDLEIGFTSRIRLTYASRKGEGSLAEAAELAKSSRTIWKGDQDLSAGMVGQGELGVLKVVRNTVKDIQLDKELQDIEKRFEGDQKGLAAIFGAVLSAEVGCAEGVMEIQGAPALFAQMAAIHDRKMEGKRSSEEVEKEVECCLDQLAEGKGLSWPASEPVHFVQFWLRLAEQLWEEPIRRRLSTVHLDATTRTILVILAGSWMELRPEAHVVIRRSHFRLRGQARRLAWPQILEWEAGAISRNVLQYLTAYHKDYRFDGILTKLMGLDAEARPLIQAHAAAEASRSLLEESAMRWAVDPSGSFRVDLPGHTSLKAWGVTSMRVWIIPQEGFWVALEMDDQPGASLQWSIHPPHLRRWILHEQVVPALHLTLAALWRDLKIGGREAILSREDEVRNPEEGKEPKLRLYGRIQWGSEEELERILREAYPVEDHVRILPQGKKASPQAYQRALMQGIVLKPGTTYVRRHQRGKPEDTEKNVPYKAQGLAKLILASRKPKRVQNTVLTR